MKDARFLSADIDPTTDTNISTVKEQALRVIHRQPAIGKNLSDAATTAILSEYGGMGAEGLLRQLCAFSSTLDAFLKKESFQEMVDLLASLLRAGVYKVADEALDAITVRRDAIQMSIEGKSTLIGNMNAELLTILSLAKENRDTELQLKAIEKLVSHRDAETLRGVSNAFKIPIRDSEKITILIQKSFDERENFLRKAFDFRLDELARFGNHAFEILWCYSKVLNGRSNRIALLNGLQHLISRINRPKQALRFLLTDFCRFPGTVHLVDRNSIMLANIMLRTYNKELDVDIEMTPEEVLNVRKGLDLDMVSYAQFRIDSVESRFATKVRTIHEQLIAHLLLPPQGTQKLTVRHLLFLEREIFIFLALLSGKTAHRILISALKEYGDPNSGIYRYPRASIYFPVFLQQLKIIARCVGRIGTHDDLDLLRTIGAHGRQLAEMFGTRENQQALARTMRWLENAIRSLSASIRQVGEMKENQL